MSVDDIFGYVRTLTKTTNYQFTDSELMVLLKIWLHKIQRAICQARSDFFGTKDYTVPLLGQEDIPLPDDCMEVKSVEVCYNADATVTEQIWHQADEIDVGQIKIPWDTIQKNATMESPKYDILDNRLWLAPVREAVIGTKVIRVRLWYIERPADPTIGTDTPMISTLNQNLLDYQPIIGLGMCSDVLAALGSPRSSEFLQRYEIDTNKMLKEIRQQDIGAITATFPYNDGSQY